MLVEIKSWIDGRILFSGEFGSLKIALEVAVSQEANLIDADLRGARFGRLSWRSRNAC